MERLTTKWNDGSYDTFDPIDIVDNEYSKANYERVLAKLGEYEDLEEQGLLMKLPCKVGDTVWFTYTNGKNRYGIEAHTIEKIVIADKFHQLRFTGGMVFTVWDKLWSYYIGKNLFLTKEEAEEALRKKVSK